MATQTVNFLAENTNIIDILLPQPHNTTGPSPGKLYLNYHNFLQNPEVMNKIQPDRSNFWIFNHESSLPKKRFLTHWLILNSKVKQSSAA